MYMVQVHVCLCKEQVHISTLYKEQVYMYVSNLVHCVLPLD